MLHVIAAIALATQQQDTIRISFPQALDRARAANPQWVRDNITWSNARLQLAGARADRYLPFASMSLTVPEYISEVQIFRDPDGTTFERHEERRLESGLTISQPLPTGGSIRVTGRLTALNVPGDAADERFQSASSLTFQLSQQLFGVNQSIRAYRLAREQYARAEAEYGDRERNLTRSVMSAYYGLVQARKQATIDSVLFVRDSLRNAAGPAAVSQDPAGEVDALKFELEAARSAFNRTRSLQNLLRARSQLNETLGLPANAIVVPDTSIQVDRIEPDVDAGLVSARMKRPDLHLAQMSVDNRKRGLRDAQRTSPVTLFINGSVGFDGASKAADMGNAIQEALATQDRANNIDLGVTIPLFDRFDERYAIARAQNDLRAAEVSLESEERQLENEVRNAAQRVNNATTQLDLAERQFEITARTIEIQLRRYSAGEIGSVELLIDQANARQAEIGLLGARVELLNAIEDWRRAIGEPSGITSR